MAFLVVRVVVILLPQLCSVCSSIHSIEQVRIIAGDSPETGLVEVLLDDRWTTICDTAWTIYDADVACRQAGFGGATTNTSGTRVPDDSPASSNGSTLECGVGSMECNGTELELDECDFVVLMNPVLLYGREGPVSVTCFRDPVPTDRGGEAASFSIRATALLVSAAVIIQVFVCVCWVKNREKFRSNGQTMEHAAEIGHGERIIAIYDPAAVTSVCSGRPLWFEVRAPSTWSVNDEAGVNSPPPSYEMAVDEPPTFDDVSSIT